MCSCSKLSEWIEGLAVLGGSLRCVQFQICAILAHPKPILCCASLKRKILRFDRHCTPVPLPIGSGSGNLSISECALSYFWMVSDNFWLFSEWFQWCTDADAVDELPTVFSVQLQLSIKLKTLSASLHFCQILPTHNALRNGQNITFPTETLYMLAAWKLGKEIRMVSTEVHSKASMITGLK